MIKSPIAIRKKYVPKDIEILYEDKSIVVIIKSAGLLSVESRYEKDITAQKLLTNYVRKGNKSATKELFAVHRLDRETSGVMIFAKTYAIREMFADQWKNVKKKYITLVRGHLAEKEGTFESYITEGENYKMHSVADPAKGVQAITKYKVFKESKKNSLLEIDLVTGKKNQIRLHMAENGHPIVGDSKYGKKSGANLALHACSISFEHPILKKKMLFEAKVPTYITNEFKESNPE
jgi:RluA family pseudouridine synthase